MTQLEPVTVVAHPNIALIKYWGKRNHQHNLPAAGSISVTLRGMSTTTTVAFDPDLERDVLTLHGTSEGTGSSKTRRVEAFLDRVRERSGVRRFARVTTTNDFPTGAGLASSASGFAALAMAASRAAGLKLDRKQLSILARIGSGSAARSIFGGYVEMLRGELDDGQDCFAQQIAGADHWDLRCVVALAA
ncbi:MAG: diphosphomevalonate decarboxylase, partial [Myxococcota bacterium]